VDCTVEVVGVGFRPPPGKPSGSAEAFMFSNVRKAISNVIRAGYLDIARLSRGVAGD